MEDQSGGSFSRCLTVQQLAQGGVLGPPPPLLALLGCRCRYLQISLVQSSAGWPAWSWGPSVLIFWTSYLSGWPAWSWGPFLCSSLCWRADQRGAGGPCLCSSLWWRVRSCCLKPTIGVWLCWATFAGSLFSTAAWFQISGPWFQVGRPAHCWEPSESCRGASSVL